MEKLIAQLDSDVKNRESCYSIPPRNRVLSEKELADELGLSPWTVRGMRLKEGCPHFTIGSRIFYRLESVLAWMAVKEAACVAPDPDEPAELGKLRIIR